MSTTPGRHFGSFSWFATNAKTSERGLLMTMLFSADGMCATLSRDERAREVVRVLRRRLRRRVEAGRASLVRPFERTT